MDHDAVLTMFDQQMRREAYPDGPGASVERIGNIVRQAGPTHSWNGILWADLDADTADGAIASQVEFFTSLGREFEWKHYSHDRPADLAARLAAAGFEAEPAETLMIAEIADLSTAVTVPDGVELRPVTDHDGVELMAQVHEQAFGSAPDRIMAQLLDQLIQEPDQVVAVVAMAGDLPVSAARMELNIGTRFASLWGGGTAPGWRGRGVFRALVAYRAAIAAERGYRYLQVDASDQSRPILERLGFHALSTTTPYNYRP